LCSGRCTTADGPCATEIEAATGSSTLSITLRRASGEEAYSDYTNYAAYYAQAYGACTTEQCPAECN
jgi:hypothetical protein